MISKIVMIDTDGDSTMINPVTKKEMHLTGGEYILSVTDYDKFVQYLYANYFKLYDKVHSTIIDGLEFDAEFKSDFEDGVSGNYCMGNYKITVIDKLEMNYI